jgi:hypothetical protein
MMFDCDVQRPWKTSERAEAASSSSANLKGLRQGFLAYAAQASAFLSRALLPTALAPIQFCAV